jgi:hypothetical protein
MTPMTQVSHLRRWAALKIVGSETSGMLLFFNRLPTFRQGIAFGSVAWSGTPLERIPVTFEHSLRGARNSGILGG